MCPPPETTVLIADDEPAVARVTSRVVDTFCTALPPVFSLEDLEEALASQVPEIVVLDVRFQNDVSSLDHLPRLATSYPGVRWILYTGCPDRAPAGFAFAAGARALVIKPIEREELWHTIDIVCSGGTYLGRSPDLREQTRILTLSEGLTEMQLKVFTGLRCKRSYAKLARELDIAVSTAEKHAAAVRVKLGISQEPSYTRWESIVCPQIDGFSA